MRHRTHTKTFGRRGGAREALIRSLVNAIVENERIRTTLPKAKELRKHVEKAITKGKDGTLHARRILLSKFPNTNTVDKIVTDLSPRFQKRNGGYTRILKLGRRPGDSAEMCYIEFVDYKLPEKKADDGAEETKSAKTKAPKAKKKPAAKKAKSKKTAEA